MITKLFFFLLSAFAILMSCTNTQTSQNQATTDTLQPVNTAIVGNDADEHGCKGSAGYRWSVVRNECIRTFESGIRLDAGDGTADKNLSAFIVFKSAADDAQAELYLPNETASILLAKVKKEEAGTWQNDMYTLTQWKGMYSLENNKKVVLYSGHAVK